MGIKWYRGLCLLLESQIRQSPRIKTQMAMNAYLYCRADSSRWRGVDARDQNPNSRELEDCLEGT